MKQATKMVLGAAAIVAVSAGVAGVTAYSMLKPEPNKSVAFNDVFQQNPNTRLAALDATQMQPVDLTQAAENSVHAVVHIKSTQESKTQTVTVRDPFYDFFGDIFGNGRGGGQQRQVQTPERVGFGSGVIISKDGYIVTNNHVIDNADVISVKLNDGREYKGRVIGTDPSTDLALVKIEADELPTIPVGNSEALKVGEWVLAVGNPFNLTSTVTAGIVSAKARSINILSGDMKIESFIQTDAAINPGNSGGALVNLQGELVGINTAIATTTGAYAGYGFAVPSSIVQKVVVDLKQYGTVQRAVLGVQIADITSELAKEKGLKTLDGVYIHSVVENGAADNAGLKSEDIIQQINGIRVNTVAQLQEQLSRFRPGDQVTIQVLRKNKELSMRATLKNKLGNTDVVGSQVNAEEYLSIRVKEIDNQTKSQLRLSYGLQITEIKKGKLFDQGIKNNYIIVSVNNQAIRTKDDLQQALDTALNAADRNKVLFITGVYPNGVRAYYAINLDE